MGNKKLIRIFNYKKTALNDFIHFTIFLNIKFIP